MRLPPWLAHPSPSGLTINVLAKIIGGATHILPRRIADAPDFITGALRLRWLVLLARYERQQSRCCSAHDKKGYRVHWCVFLSGIKLPRTVRPRQARQTSRHVVNTSRTL